MKSWLFIFVFALCGITSNAQENAWNTDLAKAIEISQKNNKPILMFFTGSDWCGWCIRLQKEVLNTQKFREWASQNVVLLELDFPRRITLSAELQKQNADLQGFFKVSGYPTIWIANAKKSGNQITFEQLGSTGYVSGGADIWLDGANKILSKK